MACLYKSDASVRKNFKLVQFLAYVPAEDVIDIFEELKQDIQGGQDKALI